MCDVVIYTFNIFATEHDTTKLIAPFHSESTALSSDTNISYCTKIPNIGENLLIIYRLGVLPKFCHFCNVLKTPNNSYQQTHHLELNRTIQIILS